MNGFAPALPAIGAMGLKLEQRRFGRDDAEDVVSYLRRFRGHESRDRAATAAASAGTIPGRTKLRTSKPASTEYA